MDVQPANVGGMVQDVPLQVMDDESQKPKFNQHQVNDVVARERARAYEKARRDLEAENAARNAVNSQPAQAQTIGGMKQLSEDEIKQMISSHVPSVMQNHVRDLQITNFANQFGAKMEAAEAKYPGLRAQLGELNFEDPSLLRVLESVNKMEHTAETMQELLANPTKLSQLMTMAEKQPKLMERSVMSLASSIKQNQDALQANQKKAQEPLGQINPSSGIGMDNGAEGDMSVGDFRKMFKSRKR